MPPPQCPECGRFLATAFVQQIQTAPAPCPRCGTELSLAEDGGPTGSADDPDEVGGPPSAPAPDELAEEEAGDEPVEPVEDASPLVSDATDDETSDTDDVDDDAADGEEGPPPTPAAALPDDVQPEPEESVRPPDLASDPLDGWDRDGVTTTAPVDEPDPAVVAAGAGVGLLLGLLLGGREHRGLGALLGAVLGAVVARLRG